jgi:hypothetical protein
MLCEELRRLGLDSEKCGVAARSQNNFTETYSGFYF